MTKQRGQNPSAINTLQQVKQHEWKLQNVKRDDEMHVPSKVWICTIPEVSCSKKEFLNWVPIHEQFYLILKLPMLYIIIVVGRPRQVHFISTVAQVSNSLKVHKILTDCTVLEKHEFSQPVAYSHVVKPQPQDYTPVKHLWSSMLDHQSSFCQCFAASKPSQYTEEV